MRTWRGRDPNRDCESEGCEGEDTCIHCDAEMISFPEEEAATLRAIHATHKREQAALGAEHQRVYTRDDFVRAIVGQQWAVACIAWANRLENDRCEWNTVDEMIEAAASLPCAHDVVEEMEKA